MSYKDLLGPDGSENNMGGSKQFVYFARHAEIKTWGEPEANPVDTDDKYVIKTAHVLATGKQFNSMYCTVDTSELEAALQGETDGHSVKLTFKFNHPGSKKAIITFQNDAKNDKFVWLVPLPGGMILQIGNKDWCAYVKPNFKGGKNSGSRFTEFVVECKMENILIYEAAVPLTPAA